MIPQVQVDVDRVLASLQGSVAKGLGSPAMHVHRTTSDGHRSTVSSSQRYAVTSTAGSSTLRYSSCDTTAASPGGFAADCTDSAEDKPGFSMNSKFGKVDLHSQSTVLTSTGSRARAAAERPAGDASTTVVSVAGPESAGYTMFVATFEALLDITKKKMQTSREKARAEAELCSNLQARIAGRTAEAHTLESNLAALRAKRATEIPRLDAELQSCKAQFEQLSAYRSAEESKEVERSAKEMATTDGGHNQRAKELRAEVARLRTLWSKTESDNAAAVSNALKKRAYVREIAQQSEAEYRRTVPPLSAALETTYAAIVKDQPLLDLHRSHITFIDRRAALEQEDDELHAYQAEMQSHLKAFTNHHTAARLQRWWKLIQAERRPQKTKKAKGTGKGKGKGGDDAGAAGGEKKTKKGSKKAKY